MTFSATRLRSLVIRLWLVHMVKMAVETIEAQPMYSSGMEQPGRSKPNLSPAMLVMGHPSAMMSRSMEIQQSSARIEMEKTDSAREQPMFLCVPTRRGMKMRNWLLGEDGNGSTRGAAYVFVDDNTGWNQQAKLTASDAQDNDQFGFDVTIFGDAALIGAPFEDGGNGDPTPDSGAAYIFTRNGTTWSEQDKLISSDSEAGDAFGIAEVLGTKTANSLRTSPK